MEDFSRLYWGKNSLLERSSKIAKCRLVFNTFSEIVLLFTHVFLYGVALHKQLITSLARARDKKTVRMRDGRSGLAIYGARVKVEFFFSFATADGASCHIHCILLFFPLLLCRAHKSRSSLGDVPSRHKSWPALFYRL